MISNFKKEKMKKYILIVFVFVSIFFSQCVDEIALDIDNNVSSVVLDGLISDSLQLQTIKLRTSAVIGVGNDNVLAPITGATVNVLDDMGTVYNFPETEDGNYELEMSGTVGKSYHVEAILADGSKIFSTPTLMTKSTNIDNVTYELFDVVNSSPGGVTTIKKGIRARVDVDLRDDADIKFLRWRAEGEYEIREAYPMALSTKICYVKNRLDLNEIQIFDATKLAEKTIIDEPIVVTEYDYRFAIMYSFNLFQYSISEKEYIYWSQIDDIINIDGNFFDPPPGSVDGNLYNPEDENQTMNGYFSVAGISTTRAFVNPDTVGFFVEERCSFSPFQPQYSECRACETIINSSVEKPLYWPN